jgi:hypothetical protein
VRRAPTTEAARELEQPIWPAPEEAAEASPGPERPQLRLAEPPRVEPLETTAVARAGKDRDARAAHEADRAAAEIAREIEERVGAAAEDFHDLRRGADAASEELGRRRKEREAQRAQEERALPGYGAIVLELLRGALRLLRAMAIAPLRIGLALLRPKEA